jgi:hypothetical protein
MLFKSVLVIFTFSLTSVSLLSRSPPISQIPHVLTRTDAGPKPQEIAKQQLEQWRAKYKEDQERVHQPPTPARAAAPAVPPSHRDAYDSPARGGGAGGARAAAAREWELGRDRDAADYDRAAAAAAQARAPAAAGDFLERQLEARRNAQRYKQDMQGTPAWARGGDPEPRLPEIPSAHRERGGGSGGDGLSQSRKLAIAKHEFIERQEMARRIAAKVNADLDRPAPSHSLEDDEDRAAAVRAQRARDKDQERKAHEAQLAAARKLAADERALAMRRPRAISPAAPAKSLESTIVLSHGKGAGLARAVEVVAIADDASRIKGQKLSAKEQQRLEHERELAEARRLAFAERQALKAKIEAELSRDVAVA